MQKIKSLKVFFLAALFVMALSSVAFAGAQDFTLVNNTGYPIYKVNVSAASTNSWEEDILGSDILPNGSSIAWYGIDLLSTYQVTLNNDGTASLQ